MSTLAPEVPDVFGPVIVVKISPTLIIGTFRIGQRTGGGALYPKVPELGFPDLDGSAPDAIDVFVAAMPGAIAGFAVSAPDTLPVLVPSTPDVLP